MSSIALIWKKLFSNVSLNVAIIMHVRLMILFCRATRYPKYAYRKSTQVCQHKPNIGLMTNSSHLIGEKSVGEKCRNLWCDEIFPSAKCFSILYLFPTLRRKFTYKFMNCFEIFDFRFLHFFIFNMSMIFLEIFKLIGVPEVCLTEIQKQGDLHNNTSFACFVPLSIMLHTRLSMT